MEKVFKLIDKIAIIMKVLCLDGKIKKLVYDDIILSLEDMKDELNKFTITDPTSSKSFSNIEKFVNEHRRGFRVSGGKLVREEDV